MNTRVLPCNCVSAGNILVKSAGVRFQEKPHCEVYFLSRTAGIQYQEEQHGKGMRLHNERIAKGKVVGHTCTVCGTRKA